MPGTVSGADTNLETTVSILIELPTPLMEAEDSQYTWGILESLHRGVRELVRWTEERSIQDLPWSPPPQDTSLSGNPILVSPAP